MKEVERPPTLTAAVANAIRESIMRGEMLPGAALREVELSKSLNTSRGTVREALRELQKENTVEVIPYRGAFVTRMTPEKVKEIYTLRALLEPYAVRLAMEKNVYTNEDFSRLNEMVDEMLEYETNDNYSEMVSTDMAIHHLLVEKCGHELILKTLQDLRALTFLFIFSTKLYQSDMTRDDASHKAIIDSVFSKNSVLAEQVLRQHINEAGLSLLQRMNTYEKS